MRCPRFGRTCFNSRSTLGLDSRLPVLTSLTIPHAGARVPVLVADITFIHGHTHTSSGIHTNARVRLVSLSLSFPPVHPRYGLGTRDTVGVMREPGRIVLIRLHYATSWFRCPFLSLSRVFRCFIGFFVPMVRDFVPLSLFLSFVIIGIALYIHAPHYEKYDCVISKDRKG